VVGLNALQRPLDWQRFSTPVELATLFNARCSLFCHSYSSFLTPTTTTSTPFWCIVGRLAPYVLILLDYSFVVLVVAYCGGVRHITVQHIAVLCLKAIKLPSFIALPLSLSPHLQHNYENTIPLHQLIDCLVIPTIIFHVPTHTPHHLLVLYWT
jgi:hypothetical protein